jgi:hypothetical protein
MTYRFVHCGLVFAIPAEQRYAAIDPVFDATGDDWVRYSYSSWLIWTEKSADHLFSLLQPFLYPAEQALVVGVDMTFRSGRMHPAIWEWMDLKLRGQGKSLWELLPPPAPPPSLPPWPLPRKG